MSDALSRRLQEASLLKPRKPESSEDRLIEALGRALEASTPERAGCPWDELEKDQTKEQPGWWLPEGE